MARTQAICSIDDCEKVVHARGLCPMHYQRQRIHGDPRVVSVIVGDDAARHEARTDRLLRPPCHIWTGPPDPDGYGYSTYEGKPRRAHVIGWMLENGSVPAGMTIDHECHNLAAERGECNGGVTCPHRLCVNPTHLAAKSMAANLRASSTAQSTINAAKTHCKNGHEFTEANTYWYVENGRWKRKCYACIKARQKRYRTAARARGDRLT